MPGEVFISSRKALRSLRRIIRSAKAAGLSYEALCVQIVADAGLDATRASGA